MQISYDIVEDMLVQGDYMNDTLQKLQDAVYLTKVLFLMLRKHFLYIFATMYHPSAVYMHSCHHCDQSTAP